MADAVAGPVAAGPATESFSEFDADPTPAPAPKEAPAPAPSAEPAPKAPDEKKDGDQPEPEAPPADAKPKPEEDKEAGADDAPPAEPEPGPFSFMGRTFKDAKAAEHYLKTQEGRSKAEAKRQQEALAKAKADAEQKATEAINAANWYKAEFEKVKAQPQDKGPEKKEPEKSFLEDPKLWTDVRKLAADEGVDAAMFYAMQQMHGHMSKEFDAKLKAELTPFQQTAQAQRVKEYTDKLFEAAADFTDDKGQPVYPELSESEETNAAIARHWVTLPPALALTEQGVHIAVSLYRAEKARQTPNPKAPAPSGASEVVKKASDEKNKPAEQLNGGGVPRAADADDPKARSRRLLGGDQPVLAAGGESLGFME